MLNTTIEKFGYPGSLLKEYDHWLVLLRPDQITLGSVVVAYKGELESLGLVSSEAFAELGLITRKMEGVLKRLFEYDKINYLCLMMVDNHVHFHVIPRYALPRQIFGVTFFDDAWPKPPVMGDILELSEENMEELRCLIQVAWVDI